MYVCMQSLFSSSVQRSTADWVCAGLFYMRATSIAGLRLICVSMYVHIYRVKFAICVRRAPLVYDVCVSMNSWKSEVGSPLCSPTALYGRLGLCWAVLYACHERRRFMMYVQVWIYVNPRVVPHCAPLQRYTADWVCAGLFYMRATSTACLWWIYGCMYVYMYTGRSPKFPILFVSARVNPNRDFFFFDFVSALYGWLGLRWAVLYACDERGPMVHARDPADDGRVHYHGPGRDPGNLIYVY